MRLRSSHVVFLIAVVVFGCVLAALVWEKTHQGGPGLLGGTESGVPAIHAETTAVDLGVIDNTNPTTRDVKLFNRGQAPLHIHSVAGSCVCLAGEVDKKVVRPGDFATLTLIFDPLQLFVFKSTKMASVHSNDPNRRTLVIEVTAEIDPEFSLEPESLDFGEVEKGELLERTMTLRQVGSEHIEIIKLDPGPSLARGVELTFEKRPEAEWTVPGKPEYIIRGRLTPEVRGGRLVVPFKIMTTCNRLKEGFMTALTAEVKTFYSVSPAQLVVAQEVHPGESRVATVTITAPQPIEVTNPATTVEGLLARVRDGDQPGTVFVDLEVGSDAQAGRFKGELTFQIRGNGRVLSETLPIFGRIAERPDIAPRDVEAG